MSVDTLLDAERIDDTNRLIEDDSGKERAAYKEGDHTIVFRNRDELPTFNGGDFASFRPILLTVDEEPHTKTRRPEFRDYSNRIAQMEPRHGDVLIANASPVGVIDLALTLHPELENAEALKKMRQNFRDVSIGPAETAFLDRMAAATLGGDETYKDGISATDGLMDLAESLGGSQEATAKIDKKLEALEATHKHHVLEQMGEVATNRHFVVEAVSSEIIEEAKPYALVRVTGNPPERDANGVLHMGAASEYSRNLPEDASQDQLYDPRGTIHFSMNHLVKSHMGGSFEGRTYAVVAPLSGAMEANGAPAVIKGVDTFFAKGPGEDIALPGAVVIEAAGNQEMVFSREGLDKKFKSEGFTRDQLKDVYDALEQKISSFGVHKLMYETQLLKPGDPNVSMYDDTFVDLLKQIPDDELDARVAEMLQRALITETMTEMNMKDAQPDNMSIYTTIDSELDKLADKLGVEVNLHSSTMYWFAEEAALENLASDRKKEKDLNDTLTQLPPPIQRLFMADGLLNTSREPLKKTEKTWETI